MSFRMGSGGRIDTRSMTVMMLIAFSIGFVVSWLPGVGDTWRQFLMFDTGVILPWTILTYPLAESGNGNGLFFFLIGMLWWFWVGSMLEVTVGKWGLLLNYVSFAAMGALMAIIGKALGMGDTMMYGPFYGAAAMTVAWCATAPENEIRLWGVFPLKAKWLAVITAAIVVFSYGTGSPLLGVFIGLPLLLGWFYGQGKLPVRMGDYRGSGTFKSHPYKKKGEIRGRFNSRKSSVDKEKTEQEFDVYYGKVRKREKEREEQERLRKLFEDSMKDD